MRETAKGQEKYRRPEGQSSRVLGGHVGCPRTQRGQSGMQMPRALSLQLPSCAPQATNSWASGKHQRRFLPKSENSRIHPAPGKAGHYLLLNILFLHHKDLPPDITSLAQILHKMGTKALVTRSSQTRKTTDKPLLQVAPGEVRLVPRQTNTETVSKSNFQFT